MDSVQRGSSSASPSSCSLNPSSLSDAEYFGSLGEDELSTLHGSSHSEYTSCFTCFTKFHITFLSRHPLLAVPVCNPCKQFYSSQTWKLYPEISSFERCRSCAKDSFKLILCKRSGCYNAFCTNCLEKNVGEVLQYNKSSWNCLVCDKSQILSAQAKYFSIFNYWREKHDHKLYLDPITKSFTSSKEVQIQYKESLFWEYELWKKLCEKDSKPSPSIIKNTGNKLLNIHRSTLKKIKDIILHLKSEMDVIPSAASEKSIENDNNKRDDDEISICSSTTPITSMTPYVKILYNDNENTKETQPVASKDGQVKIQYDTNENTNETQTGSSEDCQISIQIQNNPNKNTNETQPAETSKESQNSLNKNISDYTSNENSLIIHEIFKKELKISLKPVQESILKEIKEKGHFKISKLQKKKFDAEYAAISRLCNFKNISSHESKIGSSPKCKSTMKSRKTKDGKKKEKEAPNIEEIELDDSDESDTGFNISDSHKISSNRTIFSSSDDDGDDDVMSLCSESDEKMSSENKKVESRAMKSEKRKHESLPNFMTMSLGQKDNNQNSYSSTDDDDDNEEKRPKKKRRIIELLSDDSDENNIVQDKSMPSGSSSSTSVSSDSYASDADSLTPCSSKKKGKRIKSAKKSSDTDEGTPNKGRKKLHKIIKDHKLSEMSKEAAEIERERRKRMEEKLKMYQKEFVDSVKSSEIIEDLILDFDPETKEKRVELDKELVKQLKPHQADGIKFMWNSVFESKDDVLACKYPGGAILAHCMGLGKTLQTIALIHTVLTNFPEHITKVLVICPVNTVKNWKDEFDKWCKDSLELDVYELSGDKGNDDRTDRLNYWLKEGGVLIIGYDMFRNLTTSASRKLNKRQKGIILRSLVDPGPDLVVCDEGHVLKNRNSALNKSINKIGTKRRIILTGTPLQNNLSEYFAMVNFVKPNLLGSYKEFKNRFVNPIQNGQHSDSTDDDVRVMKKRSFILSDLLKGCLQRLDYNVLVPYLQPKYEYVLCINLSDLQKKLYMYYLENFARAGRVVGGSKMVGGKKGGLFNDVTILSHIWNHPIVLLSAKERHAMKNLIHDDEEGMNQFIDDGSAEESETSSSSDSDIEILDKNEKIVTRQIKEETGEALLKGIESEQSSSSNDWWSQFLKNEEDLQDISHSPKMTLLMEILKNADILGDKTLVFSQSLLSLDMIETFLSKMNEYFLESDKEKIPECLKPFIRPWIQERNYFRMDGSTPPHVRKKWCNYFNKTSNKEMKLFLISTKAGGLGINLVAANRVIIFDASWNPAHDLQSIFRVYRFGQTKPVYIYRFLAKGTMEEKIYDRQVTKQSLSARVVDEQQIERHFSMNELTELYTFKDQDLDEERPVPKVPIDNVFAEILSKYPEKIWKYHDHDSLLENQVDENLTEDERKAAWEEYENERKGIFMNTNFNLPNINSFGTPISSMDKNTLLQMQEAYRRQNQLLNNTSAISTPLVDKTALIQMQEDNRRQTPQFNDKTSMASMSLINEMVFHQIKEAYRRQNPRLNDDAITMATRQYILQMQTRTKALQNIYSPNIQRNPIPSTSIASVQNKNHNLSMASRGVSVSIDNVRNPPNKNKSALLKSSEENQVHNNKKLIIEKIGGNLINGNNVIPIEDIVEIEDTPNNNSFPIEDIIEKVATDNNKYNASSEDIVEITPIDNNKSLSIEKNGGKQIQEVVIDENGDNSKNSELSK